MPKKTKAPDPTPGPAVVMLPIERLAPGPNVRHLLAEEHAAAVDDLICSLRADPKIIDPLHVYHRAVPEGHTEPDHLIIHGQRRFLAAHAVGLKEVPCVVVPAPIERDRLVAQLHAQGKPISPVDEARAVNALVLESTAELHAKVHLRTNYDVAAAHLGRPVAWVRACVRLLDLSEPVLDLIHTGRLDPDDARPLFTIDPSEQPDVIGPIAAAYDGAKIPASAIREAVQRHQRRIAAAPFDTSDPRLVESAGPCSTCPFRSNAQAELFDEPPVADAQVTCLDAGCWAAKIAAHLSHVRASAAERGHALAEGKAAAKLMPKERLSKKGRAAWIDLADPCPILGDSTWAEALDQALDGEGTERPEGLPEITVVLHASGKHSTIAPRGPLSAFVRRRIDPEGAPVPPSPLTPPPSPTEHERVIAALARAENLSAEAIDPHAFVVFVARLLVEDWPELAAVCAARHFVSPFDTAEDIARALVDGKDPVLPYRVVMELLAHDLRAETLDLIKQRYKLRAEEPSAPALPEQAGTSAETPAISEQDASMLMTDVPKLDAAILHALRVRRPMPALLGALRSTKIVQLDADGQPAEGWDDLVLARVTALVADGQLDEEKHKKGTTWLAK